MGKLGDSLDQAVAKAFTRPAPKSAQAQMKYLVKQLKGIKATAEALGISQRTVERYPGGKGKAWANATSSRWSTVSTSSSKRRSCWCGTG